MIQTPTAIYVPDADGQHLIALSMTNGRQLWQAEFPGYRIDSITQEQGVIFARLFEPANIFGPNVPERLSAIDGSRGTVCWERDQQMYFLVNTPQ